MTLRDIYAALSEMPVGDVTCRNLDQLKLQVQSHDCPIRLLLPSTEGDLSFVAMGPTTRATWLIRDLCLWQPIQEGSGIEQSANDMLAYIELYAAGIRTLRNPTPGTSIVGVSYQMGPVPWAAGDFWAVDITVTVEEYDP